MGMAGLGEGAGEESEWDGNMQSRWESCEDGSRLEGSPVGVAAVWVGTVQQMAASHVLQTPDPVPRQVGTDAATMGKGSCGNNAGANQREMTTPDKDLYWIIQSSLMLLDLKRFDTALQYKVLQVKKIFLDVVRLYTQNLERCT